MQSDETALISNNDKDPTSNNDREKRTLHFLSRSIDAFLFGMAKQSPEGKPPPLSAPPRSTSSGRYGEEGILSQER